MEQRSEPRSDYFAKAKVCFPADASESSSFPALIEDRSKSGLAIRVRKPLPVGSEIRVSYGRSILRCEIRRCIPSGMEFVIGVRILHAQGAQIHVA